MRKQLGGCLEASQGLFSFTPVMAIRGAMTVCHSHAFFLLESVPSGAVSFSHCCCPQRTLGNAVSWPLCLCTWELGTALQLFFPQPSIPHCLSFPAHPLSVFHR